MTYHLASPWNLNESFSCLGPDTVLQLHRNLGNRVQPTQAIFPGLDLDR